MKKPNTNIYLLYNQERVVYVGISSVPYQAIKKHKALGKVFSTYSIAPCENETAQDLKIKILFLLHPKYNKTISISRPTCRLIGKTTSTENKRVSIPGVVIDNRLYGDFSGTGFDLKNSKTRKE